MKKIVLSLFSASVALAAFSCGAPPCPQCPKTAATPCPPAPAVAPLASADHAPKPITQLPAADSDEGMWLLNRFPSERLAAKYGFSPSDNWLNHVRSSAVRLAGGCSGSFVSPEGLIMTNHHCAHSCVEQLSTAKRDYVAGGFKADKLADEVKCPEIEINQLVGITDVTDRMNAATKGLRQEKFHAAQKAETAKIEKECATSDDLRCDVVSLYHGGQYHLYKYQRYQDVRLAFAPEFSIAFFGGDPDNFMFPRYDLDVSFVRVYRDGKPLDTSANYFKWSPSGAKEGDLTFVAGHPWSTSRELTLAELATLRDVELPFRLQLGGEMRGVLLEFQKLGKEQKRTSQEMLFAIENGLKARRGRLQGLQDSRFISFKAGQEKQFRDAINANPELKAAYSNAWDEIAAAQVKRQELYTQYAMLEQGRGFLSDLFASARSLIRYADESGKPNSERLKEFTDSKLPRLRQMILSAAPVHIELEVVLLSQSLRQMREVLGPDDPTVRAVLGKRSPLEVAEAAVRASKLAGLKVRKALFEGGKKAIDASHDPMIELARVVDAAARAVRKQMEDNVESVVDRNSELLAKARFQVYGTSTYPDATATLRLSYGSVRGWQEGSRAVSPITTIGEAFERDTGREPFALPKSWLDARAKLNLSTPLDMCTTNDIIGGNSGSPMIDKDGQVVGLIFDGNIHSLAGDYWFDQTLNRAVAVQSTAIVEALKNVYKATRISSELLGEKAK